MTEGSGYLMLTTREGSNLGKVLGLAKKKRGEGVGRGLGERWGCEEGGEPCPSVPSVPSTHPAGKPWGRSYSGGPAQNSFPSGQGCLARSASSRNRAGLVGRRGREGPSRLAAAPSSWAPGTGQGPECKDQEGEAGRGRDPGSEMGRARLEERGLALHAGGGEGGDPGAGTTEEGRTVETRAGIPGVGPARRRVGRALTSQLARKPVGAGLADGRLEEFAAGCPVGCERVPFSSQRGETREQQLSSCHGHGL